MSYRYPKVVYAIQHNPTKKMYIGSTNNLERRYLAHLHLLRSGKHPVEDMQSDFDEFGEDYSVYVLDEIECFANRGKEFDWMRKYKTIKREFGYNYKDRGGITPKEVLPLKSGLPNKPIRTNVDEKILDFISELSEGEKDFVYSFLLRTYGEPL